MLLRNDETRSNFWTLSPALGSGHCRRGRRYADDGERMGARFRLRVHEGISETDQPRLCPRVRKERFAPCHSPGRRLDLLANLGHNASRRTELAIDALCR